MVPWPDRTSLRRPLLLGAAALCLVFACVGGLVAAICSSRLVATCLRAEEAHRAHVAADERFHAAARAAGAMRDLLDDARHAAVMLGQEAERAAASDDAHPAVAASFQPLPGTTCSWTELPASGAFAALYAPGEANERALTSWGRRLATVLRAATGGGDELIRTSVEIEGLGTVGSPVRWACRAADDPFVADELQGTRPDEPARGGAAWETTRADRMIYAVPVLRHDGVRIGTARAELAGASVARALTQAVGADGAACVLVGSGGEALARSETAAAALGLGADASDEAWAAALRDGRDPGRGTDDTGSGPPAGARLVTTVPVDGTPFHVAVASVAPPVGQSAALVEPETVVLARRFGWGVLVLSLAFGGACVLGAVHVAKGQSDRLRPVVEAARCHERGDYSATLDGSGRCEVAEVARWMNTAAARLRAADTRADEIERRMHGLIDALGEGFVSTDAEDRIAHANARFADLVRRDAGDLVGRRIGDLLVPDSADTWREIARPGADAVEREVLTWATGQPPHPQTLVTRIPLRTADGRPAGNHLVVTDLTDRQRLQEEAARAMEESARAERARALAEMAGGVAHDFNNVLTVILGNAQYMLLDELPAEARETVRAIEAAALDGTASMRRVREFARPRTVPPTADVIDPCEVVDRAVGEARRRWTARNAERGAEHQVVIERRSCRRVRGDAGEISEALANLVENALEAMPSGGRLAVEVFDRGEDGVAIRVEDSGVGMTPEVAKKVFDPFFTTKSRGRCVGLGLSIAYGIVRAHRGRIDVRSAPGEGSAFTVVLPAVESAPVTDALPADGAPRVLVVGADANEVRVLSEEVSRLGVAATPAQPASALPLVSDPALFHVLVVEHELGGSTGWDLARQARAARDDLRIVLLTEPAHAVSETQARNAGIDGVLVRPFDAREVHAEVFAVLAAPRGRRSARPAADADSGRTLRNAEVT